MPSALLALTYAALVILAILGALWGLDRLDGKTDMKLSDFARIAQVVAPFVLAMVPGIPPSIIPALIHGIQVAETLPGADGAAKKKVVLDLASTAISATNDAAKKQVIDPTAINAISNGIDTTIGVINLVKGKQVAPDADIK